MWQQYLDDEWNRPSRADYYIMKLTFHISRMFRTGSKSFNSKDWKIPFGESKPVKPLSKEEATQQSKRAWLGRFGKGVRIIKKEKD